MEVSAKHEGQTLTFFLVGELDHHGAKGLLENLEREIERTLPSAKQGSCEKKSRSVTRMPRPHARRKRRSRGSGRNWQPNAKPR